MLLEGIFLPLTTPFYPDGRVYLKKLEANVDRYSRTPAAGMLVLGETSEAEGLTDDETAHVLSTAIAAAAKDKVMLASIGRPSVFATLVLAELAAAAHYDAIVVSAPAFAADSTLQPQLMTYLRAIADRAPLPVVLLAGEHPLPADLLADLASHPRIIAAIDAHASPARMETLKLHTAGIAHQVTVTSTFAAVTARMLAPAPTPGGFVSAASLTNSQPEGAVAVAVAPPTLKTRTKTVGFQVLAGSAHRMLQAWQAGASGALPPVAACAPQGCCEVWQAFKDGDPDLAEEKQHRLTPAAHLMPGWAGIPAIKHGCDLNGYFGGRPRLPLLALTATQREQVEEALASMPN